MLREKIITKWKFSKFIVSDKAVKLWDQADLLLHDPLPFHLPAIIGDAKLFFLITQTCYFEKF